MRNPLPVDVGDGLPSGTGSPSAPCSAAASLGARTAWARSSTGVGDAPLVPDSAHGAELGVELAGLTGGDVALHRGGGTGGLSIGQGQDGSDRVGGVAGGQVVP